MTTLENCQALCGSCNLRKGSRPQAVAERLFEVEGLAPGSARLRHWQTAALEARLEAVTAELERTRRDNGRPSPVIKKTAA